MWWWQQSLECDVFFKNSWSPGRCLLASSLVSQPARTGAYLVAQTVKRLPTMREAWVRSLGQEDPLEKEMASHSSTLAQNSMDGGAWWATVHGVAKNRTRLIDFTFCPQGPRGTGESSLKAAPGDPTLLRRIPAATAVTRRQAPCAWSFTFAAPAHQPAAVIVTLGLECVLNVQSKDDSQLREAGKGKSTDPPLTPPELDTLIFSS